MSEGLSSFYARRVVLTVWSFRAAPPAPVLGARKRLQPFILKIGPVFHPRALSFNISALVTPIPPGSKKTRVNLKISLTGSVSNASTLTYHFELVHREALYFPKQNWFGLL